MKARASDPIVLENLRRVTTSTSDPVVLENLRRPFTAPAPRPAAVVEIVVRVISPNQVEDVVVDRFYTAA